MGIASEEAIHQFRTLMDQIDEPLKKTFENIHNGYPKEALVRFLKAREWNVANAHKMLLDCLKWRVQNEIDNILSKPIVPIELYRAVRESQLIGLSGYSREVFTLYIPFSLMIFRVLMITNLMVLNRKGETKAEDIERVTASLQWLYILICILYLTGGLTFWQGLPVFAIGVGLSTYDKASVHYYVQSYIQINEYRDRVILPSATKKYGRHINTCLKVLDMTGLKLSALSQIKLLTIITSIDDLNYPEKTTTYYIVNAPYVFSACWKVVKPLLQERTRKKIQVLSGSGKDELLKVMDYDSLPHFCRKEGLGSSRRSGEAVGNCFSLDHPFHQQLYNHIKHQASVHRRAGEPIKQGSFHVDLPNPPAEEAEIARSIESELHKLRDPNGFHGSVDSSESNDD